MQDLDPTLRDAIDLTFRQARKQLQDGDIAVAVNTAETAWDRLPEPKFNWDVSKSYAIALAAIYRDAKQYDRGLALLQDLFSSGTVKSYQDRPYFIMGTIYYEMGNMADAKKWLGEADKISKGRCFRDEPEKYKKLVVEKSQ